MTCDEKTSPGQTMCVHLDKLMWTRLALELVCRRVVELERQVQAGPIRLLTWGDDDA